MSQSDCFPPALAGVRVLLVADSLDERVIYSAALDSYGASVRTAHSVREALEVLLIERFDVLVCEVVLPLESGYDLIRTVRELDPTCNGRIPAVAITSLLALLC